MSLLYVAENGTTLGVNGGCFVLKHTDQHEEAIPKETISSICIFGKTQITTQCTEFCLKKGIRISYFSQSGSFYGTLLSPGQTNIKRLRKQLQLTDDPAFSLSMAKKIIDAKIHNQFVIANRYQKSHSIEAGKQFFQMKNARKHVQQSLTTEELMGYEGIASRNYFEILAMLIDPAFIFSSRNRRPAQDPFNCMLNLGYSILNKELYGQIENRSLSPYAGFLHKDRENHPALASDMIEEWRPVLIDSCVLSLIQGHEISLSHFCRQGNATFMTKEGIKLFLTKLEQKMYVQTKYLPDIVSPIDFRHAIWHQAEAMTQAIEKESISLYNPIRIR